MLFIINIAEEKVKNYCHIDKIPYQLENTVIQLACDIYRNEGYSKEVKPQEVTSIKRGDVSTSFSSVSVKSDYDFIEKYKRDLARFRRVEMPYVRKCKS